jgi:tRNA(Ile2) C34 agmatinyltransferase TiaS
LHRLRVTGSEAVSAQPHAVPGMTAQQSRAISGITPEQARAILQGIVICGDTGRLGGKVIRMLQRIAVQDLHPTSPRARTGACAVKTGLQCPACRGRLTRLGRKIPQFRCEGCGTHYAKTLSADEDSLEHPLPAYPGRARLKLVRDVGARRTSGGRVLTHLP